MAMRRSFAKFPQGTRRRSNFRLETGSISPSRMDFDAALGAVTREARVKLGRFDWRYAVEHWLRTAIIGPAFLRYVADDRDDVEIIPEMSETLTIDG